MPPALQFLVLTFAGWVNRHQDDLIAYLREENRVLREHLGPRPLRRTDAQRRRLAVRGQKLGRRVLMQVAGIVTPDTILRWYRRLIAQTYDGSARRGRGRPMTRRAVAVRVVRMAVENPQWGDTRIRGALSNLGHEIARTTVKRILHDHGIDPAPERSRRLPWKTFLQAHWEGLTACDRFTVEGLTLAGLQRSLVCFVIALQSRRVTIAGIHPQPYGAWMEQMARNLTDPVDGCLRRARSLMHDRDPLDTRVFGEILEGGVSSRSVSRRRVPISTRMPSGSSAVPTKNLIRTVCVTDRAVLGRRTITSVGMADVRSVEVDGRLASFGRSSGRRVSVHGLQAPAIRGCGQAACRW